MPSLDTSEFNIIVTALGGYITVFGLVSFLLKERFFISEALLSMIFGVILSNHGLGWLRPLHIAQHSHENLEAINLNFTRIVLSVSLFLAGVGLPKNYSIHHAKDLAILLGPVMTMSWLVSGLIMYAMIPNCSFLMSLAIAACITPTDPVLSNSIVKGRFADAHIPPKLQTAITAESGSNDGLGYPFLFFALYMMEQETTAKAMGKWFGETWGYEVLLSIVFGATMGYVARKALWYAEKQDWVDKESFFVHAVTLAIFTLGLGGIIGTDDVLACFVAGCAFTHDDWFKEKTEKDSLQPTMDMLLNVSIFAWFGAVCPWHEFRDHASGLSLGRLVGIAVLVLLFRRLPAVWLAHRYIPAIKGHREALFAGFFGPMGVGAVFYIHIAREFLRKIPKDHPYADDAERLAELIRLVVWFLVMSSVIVHGFAIPLVEIGMKLPTDSDDDDAPILPKSMGDFFRNWFGGNNDDGEDVENDNEAHAGGDASGRTISDVWSSMTNEERGRGRTSDG